MISYRTSNALRDSFICLMCLAMIGGMPLTARSSMLKAKLLRGRSFKSAGSPLSYRPDGDQRSHTGNAAFSFNGREDPPVIRVFPGEDIRLTYVNAMSKDSHESASTGPCMNMTNLHFHGLHVSPDAPQDDVISMMAMPGQSLHYVVNIPLDQPPGLYWYHTHPHGESYQQDLDGMSGAIVIDGIERYRSRASAYAGADTGAA
jgi:FtsP/CotA-like multicopper oxidase with cupredoxin domain